MRVAMEFLSRLERTMKILSVFIIGIILLFSISGCTPVVKTDLKSLNENPEQYQDKEVIVVTDLASVVETPHAYRGRKVELKGYVEYKGFWASNYWNFILKDETGTSIKCFERNYRVDAWLRPVVTVKRAEREKQLLTVVGNVEMGPKIELDWIEYEGEHIDTDLKPRTMLVSH